ncbi:MAG: anti-sigma factor [Pseudonocardiales bacterium]|nr:anti-sigma factor [Actinomycetota bacterium]
MTAHISEELPRLLTGEATRDVVQGAAAHLRTCEDCQQELVSAVVAHASLTSAQRFAPEIVAGSSQEHATASFDSATLPDLSAIFAQVREEAEQVARPVRRSRRPLYAVAAIAAGIVIGTGGTALIQNLGDHNTPAGRSVALDAFQSGTASAKATVRTNGQMQLNAASLPKLDTQHRYEVWLTNKARSQMQPIGWIDTDGKATLTVPANLMSRYNAIEVSVQDVDAATYTYSGTSVLRGAYTA